MTRHVGSAVVMAGVALLCGAAGRANGRFPRAQDVIVGPGATSETVAVRSTFGILLSDDSGRTFRFFCEEAFEYLDGYDPSIALGAGSRLMVGLPDGLMTLRDRCRPARVDALRDVEVIDLATGPTGAVVYAALGASDGSALARIARSDDGGQSFRITAAALAGVRLETVEIAPSDPQRVYASGTDTATQRPVLYRSDDGASSFRRVADTAGALPEGARGLFVSAVDPRDADVLYVRVPLGTAPALDAGGPDAAMGLDAGDAAALDGATALLRSDDGGASFRELTRTRGPMRGFALSDDGKTVFVGGPDPADRLARSDDGGPFARVNDVSVECLRYHAGALYVCESFVAGATMLGRSTDRGVTVTEWARFDAIQPPPRCPAGTLLGDVCPLRWSSVRAVVAPSAPRDAGSGSDGGTSGGHGRCGCRVVGTSGSATEGWLGLLLGAASACAAACGRPRRQRRS